jgi:hypothetical protein
MKVEDSQQADTDEGGPARHAGLDSPGAEADLTTRLRTKAEWAQERGLLLEERAFRSAFNQRGPWWNSGASHMNQAYPKSFFDRLGLVSLLDTLRRLQCVQ